MAQPPLTRDRASEAVERVNAKLREGYRPQGMTGTGPGAISAAAAQAVKDGFCQSAGAFVSRQPPPNIRTAWGHPQRIRRPRPMAANGKKPCSPA